MDDATRPTRSGARRPAVTTTALLLLGVGALLAALALGWWSVDHVRTTRLWRVESVVAPALVGLGTCATAWLGLSSLVAATCGLARVAGGPWHGGERAVQRWAPGVVRRALTVAVAAGVGLGTAVGAQATPVTVEPVAVVDLGWAPTTSARATDSADVAEDPDAAGPAQHDAAHVPDAAPAPAAAPATSPAPAAPASSTPPAAPTATSAPAADAQPADAQSADAPPAGARVLGATTAGPTGPPSPASLPQPASAPPAGAPAPATAPPASPTSTATGATVVVEAGDTLWGIAARHLGPDATDAQIADAWPRWYEANASVIGADPDVVQPGQLLQVPATLTDGAR